MARKFRMFMAVADANELSKCCGVPFTPGNGDGVCLVEMEWSGQERERLGKVLAMEWVPTPQSQLEKPGRRRTEGEIQRVARISAEIAHGNRVR